MSDSPIHEDIEVGVLDDELLEPIDDPDTTSQDEAFAWNMVVNATRTMVIEGGLNTARLDEIVEMGAALGLSRFLVRDLAMGQARMLGVR